jgi:D-alanine-D-alanine ligase
MNKTKLKVGILFGGQSAEHEVSISSAVSVFQAIDKKKYEAIPIGITNDGQWLSPQESQAALNNRIIEKNSAVAWRGKSDKRSSMIIHSKNTKMEYSLFEKIDVVFPVLHGPYGEDGTVQGLLELWDIPYVGSGVAASSIAMDKDLMKRIFQQAALPQTNWLVIKRNQWKQERKKILDEINHTLNYPLFVKPTNLGSSIGISKVEQTQELEQAIELAASYDRKIMIEEGITEAREMECSILGNDQPEASVIGEIQPGGDFYDYESKYFDQNTQLIIPARIEDRIVKEIQRIARMAYLSIDACGMARVDFFVQKNTDSYQVYLNEINTIPGFTRMSMYPKLWEKSGIGFRELIDRLIKLALERFQDKMASKQIPPPGS